MKTSHYKIEIPEPCTENWDKMTPKTNGRFCGSCAKTVIDFSTLENDQITNILLHNDNVCGRFRTDQLNTVHEIPRKERFKLARFAAACLLVFGLGLFTYSCELESPQVQLIDLVENDLNIHSSKEDAIIGDVVLLDTNTHKLIGDTIILSTVEPEINTTSQEYELGEVEVAPPYDCIIPDNIDEVPMENDTTIQVDIIGEKILIMGAVEAIEKVPPYEKPESIPNQKIVVADQIKLYPNPAHNTVNFSFTPKELAAKENIKVEIFNAMGALVMQEELHLERDSFTTQFDVSRLNDGNYFFTFVYKQERFSEQFLVQH